MSKQDPMGDREKDNSTPQPNGAAGFQHKEKEKDAKVWKFILFGSVAATATTMAVTHLRGTVDWVYYQLTRSLSSLKGSTGRSSWSSFREEAQKRHNRRIQELHEEEMERVERVRRMQSVFNRARNKSNRSYESWSEGGPGAYHQHFQRNDWYWKTDTSSRNQDSDFKEVPRASPNCVLSHHYSILGLDRVRTKPYTDDEIKSAFRAKAKEFHPDQNQGNKEVAEAKFKEIMVSYQTIKAERRNNQNR